MNTKLDCESKNLVEKNKVCVDQSEIGKLYDHLKATRRAAMEYHCKRKLLLRETLKLIISEATNEHQSGINPLLIFPEEIWTMILEHVHDSSDLENCYKTCTLFHRLLGDDKIQFLFPMVFPLISGFLTTKEILNCRKVCIKWRWAIDSSLENYYNVRESNISQYFMKADGNGRITRLSRQIFENKFEVDIRSDRERGPWNPFIGRFFTVKVNSAHQAIKCVNFHEFRKFVMKFGNEIKHLTLFGGESFSRSPYCIYSLAQQSLENCSNLTSLRLNNWDDYFPLFLPTSQLIHNINRNLPLAHHNCLNRLIIDIGNPKAIVIQDKLIEKFSQQLKHVEVHHWNLDYKHFEWPNMKKLVVFVWNEQLLESLLETSAPNLDRLIFRFNGNVEKLETLIKLSHHFKNLEHLSIKIEKGSGFVSAPQILKLSPELIGSPNLSTLDITVLNNNLDLTFLICFPLLKTIIIRQQFVRFRFKDSQLPNYDRSLMFRKGISAEFERDFETLGKKSEDEEMSNNETSICLNCNKFLEILEYIPKDMYGINQALNMYQSNIWEILQHLQKLEIRNAYLENNQIVGREMMYAYTREGYVRSKLDKWELLKSRLQFVREQGIQRRRELKGDLQNKLIQMRSYIKNQMRKGTNPTFSVILPLIFTKLEKLELLNCRRVCKEWCDIVDGEESHRFTYFFKIPPSPGSVHSHDEFLEDMMNHPKNPFIGGRVTFILESIQEDLEEGVEIFKRLLGSLGKYISNLKLAGFGDTYPVHPSLYNAVCFEILKECKNLQSLTFDSVEFQPTEEFQAIIPLFPRHNMIENLTVDAVGNSNLGCIQTELLTRYRSQLKRADLCYWDESLNNITDWNCLLELTISQGVSDLWLPCIKKMKAPNLETLQINLRGDRPKLQMLLELTNRFPKLSTLNLDFVDGNGGMYCNEAIDVLPRLCFSSSLKTLRLFFYYKCNISFNFLVYFPNLRILEMIKSLSFNNENSLLFDEDEAEAMEKYDFVKIPEFWDCTEGKHEFETNIWEILPTLECLIIRKANVESVSTGKLDNKVFTRFQYEQVKTKRAK